MRIQSFALFGALLLVPLLVHAQPSRLLTKPDLAGPASPAYEVPPSGGLPAPLVLADHGDDRWDDRFGRPGVSSEVFVVSRAPDGMLYAGGWFTHAGGLEVNNIARWDGRSWHPLGSGVTDGYYITDIAFAADGDVFVTGNFTEIGGVPANNVARWDGERWHALEDGVSSTAHAVAIIEDAVYVGGEFREAGGEPIFGLARFDRAARTWSPVGRGIGRLTYDGSFDGEHWGTAVHALLRNGDHLYVGGAFEAVSDGPGHGLAAIGIAMWDGTSWRSLGRGLGTVAGSSFFGYDVYALALLADGSLIAGGSFEQASNIVGDTFQEITVNGIARWDGTEWQALGTGVQNGTSAYAVKALLADGDRIYAGGSFTSAGGVAVHGLAMWDAGTWNRAGEVFNDDYYVQIATLALDADGHLIVGGQKMALPGDREFDYIARWDGAAWHTFGHGLASSSVNEPYALAVRNGVLIAGGDLHSADGRPIDWIAQWDGLRWSDAGIGPADGRVEALATAPNGDVYAGGSFTTIGGTTANRIARWDGTRWHALGTGMDKTVTTIAVAPDGDVYAGGWFDHAGGVESSRIARWDGARWHALGEGLGYVDVVQFPNETVVVRALAVADDGSVYAGGTFHRVGGILASRVARWDGVQWHALGKGVSQGATAIEGVYALEAVGGDVYVGGEFSVAGTMTAPGLARWSMGTGWSAVGAGLGGGEQKITALSRNGNLLYAGGHFERVGTLEAKHIAVFDLNTETWSTLGTGIERYERTFDLWPDGVRALAIDGNDVWVGGNIIAAGGHASYGIARWSGTPPEEVAEAEIALDPETIAFGAVAVGQPEVRLLTVTNTGEGAGLTATIGPSIGPFRVVEGGGTLTLDPGASREILVEFAPLAPGLSLGTLSIAHDAPNRPSPVPIRLTGTGQGAPLAVLRNFDPAGPQQLWPAAQGGFVFGTNGYGDRAKATALAVPPGKQGPSAEVQAINLWFAYKHASPGEATYTLKLFAGTPASGPVGEALVEQTYRVADIIADQDPSTVSEPTTHLLSAPIAVPSSFFAAVEFGTYQEAELLALAATDRLGERVDEVWEQLSDGTWVNVSDSWSGDQGQPGTGTDGWHLWVEAVLGTAVGTSAETPALREAYGLSANYPNPFNPSTVIRYALPTAEHVTLTVFDLTGKAVATLVDRSVSAGTHAVTFDAGTLANGVYFYRLTAGSFTQTRAMMLVK